MPVATENPQCMALVRVAPPTSAYVRAEPSFAALARRVESPLLPTPWSAITSIKHGALSVCAATVPAVPIDFLQVYLFGESFKSAVCYSRQGRFQIKSTEQQETGRRELSGELVWAVQDVDSSPRVGG